LGGEKHVICAGGVYCDYSFDYAFSFWRGRSRAGDAEAAYVPIPVNNMASFIS